MLNWSSFSDKKKKERVRKGIPNNVRKEAWPLLLNAQPYREEYPVEIVQRMVVNLDVRLVDEVQHCHTKKNKSNPNLNPNPNPDPDPNPLSPNPNPNRTTRWTAT